MTEETTEELIYEGTNPLFKALESIMGVDTEFVPDKELFVSDEHCKEFLGQVIADLRDLLTEEQRKLAGYDIAYMITVGLCIGTRHTQIRLAKKLRDHGQGLAAAFIEEEFM